MGRIVGINHVAFSVKDFEKASQTAIEILGGELLLKFECIDQKYKGASVQVGNSMMTFLESTDESGFIAQHINKHGIGVQHIGLEIENLKEYVEQLEKKGVRVEKSELLDEEYPEALVGPRIGSGVVLQLMEWSKGPLDVSEEGKKRLRQKYVEKTNMIIIE
jgi:methylmalonyl-CoA/ethylmalonyl-CoA epimerase